MTFTAEQRSEIGRYEVPFKDIFKNNVFAMILKMSSLHKHIRGPDCIKSFYLCIV